MATLGKAQSREKAIFFQALERGDAQERAAYLSMACGGDFDLRGRVEELLIHHFEQDGFMKEAAIVPVAPPPVPVAISEGPGSRIGRYKLLQKIGEGGMGMVYMAEQEEPVRRRVALKIIKLGMDTQQVVARFEAELQALALMDHPNIARVLDGGATDTGRPYFVMELVQGIPITEFCDQNRFSVVQRLKLLIPICEAIQSAHQKGVIHRDLKPSNILVQINAGAPLPKIIDFGVVKATNQKLTEKTLFTSFATMVGTPAYMSPEQAEMSSLDVDTRADIYSLGVLLYELLTHTTPFPEKRLREAGYREMQRIILEEEPERPSARVSTLNRQRRSSVSQTAEMPPGAGLAKDLDWIVLKCLEKDRARRYETSNGLAMDIQRFLTNEPVLARPPSALYRFQKFVRRNRVALTMAGFLVVVLILATVFSATLAVRALKAERLAAKRLDSEIQARAAAAQAQTQALRDRDDAQRRLFDARLAQAQAARWSGRAGRRFEGLKDLTEAAQIARELRLGAAETVKIRNEAIALSALTDLRLDHKWAGYPPGSGLTGIGFDREMERYALVDKDGTIKIRRLSDNVQTGVLTNIGGPAEQRAPDWRMNLRFSADGHYLAASGNLLQGGAPMQVWDLRTSEPVLQLMPGNAWESRAFDFSSDSRVFVAGRPDRCLAFYDLASGTEMKRVQLMEEAQCIRFHPKSDQVAVCAGSQVLVIDTNGQAVITPLAHPRTVGMVAWNPEGMLLAASCFDGKAYVWNASGRQQAVCAGHEGSVMNATFNPESTLLATSGGEETRLWDPWTGKELLRASGLATEFGRVKWLGLGMLGPEVGRWEVALGPEFRQFSSNVKNGGVIALAFSAEGRWLASAGEGGARLWDMENGRLVGSTHDRTFSVTFEPVERSLLTSGSDGLCRWPLGFAAAGLTTAFDPATRERLPVPCTEEPRGASLSVDGTAMAMCTIQGRCFLFSLADPTAKVRLIDYPVSTAAISRRGRWVATTTTDAYEAKLWDGRDGSWVQDFPGVRTATATFTPDDQWLVFATAQDYRFYRVGSWEPGPCVRREYAGYASVYPAFSTEGGLVAIAHSKNEISLLDAVGGQVLATFGAPDGDELHCLCLSADGSRLAAGTHTGLVQVWDLRRLRARLGELGVDWKPARRAQLLEPTLVNSTR